MTFTVGRKYEDATGERYRKDLYLVYRGVIGSEHKFTFHYKQNGAYLCDGGVYLDDTWTIKRLTPYPNTVVNRTVRLAWRK
jgi:hypothetical protein